LKVFEREGKEEDQTGRKLIKESPKMDKKILAEREGVHHGRGGNGNTCIGVNQTRLGRRRERLDVWG